jgi:heme A synthase
MSQDSIFGFPIPVLLAFVAAVLLLFALARILASLSAPVRVRDPGCAAQCEAEKEEAAWRL